MARRSAKHTNSWLLKMLKPSVPETDLIDVSIVTVPNFTDTHMHRKRFLLTAYARFATSPE